MLQPPPTSPLFPYTTLFRSRGTVGDSELVECVAVLYDPTVSQRSEEHTSELQSHVNLVCRLLLEKKKQARTDRGAAGGNLHAPGGDRACGGAHEGGRSEAQR